MLKSMPKLAIGIAVGLLLASALALIATRGEVLMLDLTAIAGMICF